MAANALKTTAFRGDPDLGELHAFFQPEHQFAGDMRWTFGTSLKSAYVNSFEFMNHAPVVQLWRDRQDAVQAVSRLSLGTGEWFQQAAPGYRRDDLVAGFIEQADSAFRLLTDHQSWCTVGYESNRTGNALLERFGYVADGIAEVYMERSLEQSVEPVPAPSGIQLRLLDSTNVDEVQERARSQVDAFTDGEPTALESAWIVRTLPHQLAFGQVGLEPNIVALDADDSILAFADVFLDRKNRIGEFEPVGTRKSARRLGLAKAVTTRGLQEMQEAGMRYAVVRTGNDNAAAIAAYESVGFQISDHLIRFRRSR